MVPIDSSQLVPTDATCTADLPKILCIIQDVTNPQWQTCKFTVNLPMSTTVAELCEEVARQANYEPDTFELLWQRGGKDGGDDVLMNDKGDKSLGEIGMLTEGKNLFSLQDKDGMQPVSIQTGATGVTTSPSDVDALNLATDDTSPIITATSDTSSISSDYSSYVPYSPAVIGRSETGFVGLVNQAMTCYLNSLIQTLYMTPEFRNAIYKWELTAKEENPTNSIPYQLQRLFVQLQTSKKRSVETTDVTRSFGWDSSEAWQQHDVQELCRVMFDALEKKWKDTDQQNLINHLYQGQMKDYVKCLKCGYESARTDAFLDIPLVIRPFGGNKVNGSVDEALQAFVEPEILNESNQYFCEKCNMKCDAHKGLKFQQFPYLLTLQLKRFDFDYNTMHRIKLNDKMTFPEILDLNSFIESETAQEETTKEVKQTQEEGETQSDSGAENEDGSPSSQSQENSLEDALDEGIDMEHASTTMTNHRNDQEKATRGGPYRYQLFSIMVHSGTASGGHYYAYIKSFTDDQWYCFNDQHVSRITYDDIRKTYGGEPTHFRGYYSSSYTSSTNAYMLMYRQIDPRRNANFIKTDNFPAHILNLSQGLHQEEEEEKRQREIERNTCKIKLFGFHPLTGKLIDTRLEVHKDRTLTEATQQAHKLLGFQDAVPVSQCRLVKYDEFHESLERSYEGEEDTPMGQLLGGVKGSYMFDLLMETRSAEQQFQVYKPGGVTIKLFVVDLRNAEIRNPITTRTYHQTTVRDLQQQIEEITGLPAERMRLVLEKYYNELRLLSIPSKNLKSEGFSKCNKVFVEASGLEDPGVEFPHSRLHSLLDRHANTIRLLVTLPPAAADEEDSAKDEVSETSSSIDSVAEKFSDLQVETGGLSPNKIPTPSPTGSSSTLSDDHPLEKNGVNLVGSETDSGVVSLNEARLTDEQASEFEHIGGEVRSEPDGRCDSSEQLTAKSSDPLSAEALADALNSTDLVRSESSSSSTPQSQPEQFQGDQDEGVPVMQTLTSPRQIAKSHLTLPVASQSQATESASCAECSKLQVPDSSSLRPRAMSPIPGPLNPQIMAAIHKRRDAVDQACDRGDIEGAIGPSGPPLGQSGPLIGPSGPPIGWTDPTQVDSDPEVSDSSRHQCKKKNWYFKPLELSESDEGRVLVVNLDKRMSLGFFKTCMEPHVGTTSLNFKVYRLYANNQEYESIRLNETLQTYSDDTRIVIKLGRALRKGEYRVNIYQLMVNSNEPIRYLFDWVFAKGMTVLESKQELLPELKKKFNIDVPLDRLRLRKKSWKNPATIFQNDRIYEEDIAIFPNWEVFVELLDRPEQVQSSSKLALYVRRWRPSEMKLDPFEEVVLDNASVIELKTALCEISGIPIEYIEFAKGRGTFPCEVSLLDMNTELEWEPRVTVLNTWPLYITDDGTVIYYRDNREELKELQEDEKREIQKKENARLSKSGQKVTYSPRKERALKIYTDSPPQYSAMN
ncbi:ubiquitin carboxyl-terminal hydrolase 47-like [Diadema setosum]|uniref:ubiquitin carboxyl-terminal hydrolase 47-like n=1 Tax=Diadema setosum TaxID=31175 RepID=UPI003B3B4DAF